MNFKRGSYTLDYIHNKEGLSSSRVGNPKKYDQDQKVIGQTFQVIIIKNCKFSVSIRSTIRQNSINFNSTINWQNGSRFIVPAIIANKITQKINKITHSNPYFYVGQHSTMQMLCKIKVGKLELAAKILKNKIQTSVKKLQQILCLYGIIRDNNCMGSSLGKSLTLKKIQILKISLSSKQKVTSLLKQAITNKQKQKQNQKEKQKQLKKQSKQALQPIQEQNNDIQESQQNQYIQQKTQYEQVCQYYDKIQQIPEQQDRTQQKIHHKILKNQEQQNNRYILNRKLFKLTNIIKEGCQNMGDVVQNNNIFQQNGTKTGQVMTAHKILMTKCVNEYLPQKVRSKAQNKLLREISIIKSIKFDTQYFLRYYFPNPKFKSQFEPPPINNSITIDSQQVKLYMDCCQSTLTFLIDNQLFKVDQVFQRLMDIVNGIKCLHKSGIVHRDLKPDNIMIPCTTKMYEKNESKLKIIDFSDSALFSQSFSSQLSNFLGYSLPYSPLECCFDCDFGVKNPQIDIWSLGIILHQLFYKRVPNLYTRNNKLEQFYSGIKNNQLLIKLDKLYKTKSYIGYLQQIVHTTIGNCVYLKQTDRISIETLHQINNQIILLNKNIQIVFDDFYK